MHDKKLYKIGSMLCLLVMILAACVAPGTSGPAPAAAGGQPITLNVWLYPYWSGVMGTEDPAKSTPADIWQFMAKKFQETHPNVTFNFEVLDWGTGRQKVNIAISSKSWPDILANEDHPVLMRYAMMGVLQPIDDFMTADDRADFQPAVLKSISYQGHMMMWPWAQNASFWVANKKIFEEKGVTNLLPTNADHSWSFAEFLKAAQATTFSRSGGTEPDVYGVCADYKEGPGDYNRFGFLWGQGARFYSDDFSKFTINSPQSAAGLQNLYDLEWKYKVAVPGSAGLSSDDCQNAFMQGKVAMKSGGPELEAAVAQAEQAGTIKAGDIKLFGVLPPSEPGASPAIDGPLISHAVFKQSDPEKAKVAMEFLHLVTSSEYMKMVKPSGNAAVRKSVGNLYPDSELATWWQSVLKYVAPDQSSPFNKDMRAVTVPMFQEVMTGQKPPAQALADAEQKGNALLQSLLAQLKPQ